MNILKKAILPLCMFIILVGVLLNLNKISMFVQNLLRSNPNLVVSPGNEYTKKDAFLFVKPSNNYEPYGYQELLSIFYSVINNGWESFTFYCPNEYVDCINDVKKISDNNELLTHLNNYAHPYNNFSNLKTVFDEAGEVTIEVTHLYSEDVIKKINTEVDQILDTIIKEDMDDQTKILTVHDYIIEHATYDIEKNQTGESAYHSNIAYGPLIEGYAICGGYADAMAIFLTKLGYRNYKIASATHVWNAVYLDDKWMHLDLTWDDPVSEQGVDYLYHKYFLVTNSELKAADGNLNNHEFDHSIYLEFKN